MIKIVISSYKLFKILINIKFVKKFIVFNIKSLDSLSSIYDFALAVSTFSTESKHGKTTSVNRFLDLDSVVIKFLSQQSKIEIHDVAVSSGVTSCELLHKVKALNVPYNFSISDKYANYFISGNKIIRIYSADKKLLYGYVFGVLADGHLSRYFLLSKLLYFLFKYIPHENKFDRIQLFDFETKRILKSNIINYIEYDLFGVNSTPVYNFVRCMNALNANSWFSEEQIILGVSNLKSSLIDGGVLLIGRTDDFSNQNNASFFKKINDKLVHLEDFNLGSDIKNIIINNFQSD